MVNFVTTCLFDLILSEGLASQLIHHRRRLISCVKQSGTRRIITLVLFHGRLNSYVHKLFGNDIVQIALLTTLTK